MFRRLSLSLSPLSLSLSPSLISLSSLFSLFSLSLSLSPLITLFSLSLSLQASRNRFRSLKNQVVMHELSTPSLGEGLRFCLSLPRGWSASSPRRRCHRAARACSLEAGVLATGLLHARSFRSRWSRSGHSKRRSIVAGRVLLWFAYFAAPSPNRVSGYRGASSSDQVPTAGDFAALRNHIVIGWWFSTRNALTYAGFANRATDPLL